MSKGVKGLRHAEVAQKSQAWFGTHLALSRILEASFVPLGC